MSASNRPLAISRIQLILGSMAIAATMASCQPQVSSSRSFDGTLESADQTEETDPEKSDASSSEPVAADSGEDKEQSYAGNREATPEPIYAAVEPGEYCYQLTSETQTINTQLQVDSSDQVTGRVLGSVHNEESAYYTGYVRALNGTIDGSNLNLDVATWIEYDRQNEQQTWRISEDTLKTDRETLQAASCEAVSKAFENEDGLEAHDLTEGANRVKTEQVFFEPGTSSATVGGSVVRGDRDVYLLTADGGQTMTVNITSLEDNAVFDIVTPSGLILDTESMDTRQLLPHRGDYQIIVGGTRGNATYELTVAIE